MRNLLSLIFISVAYFIGYSVGKRNGRIEYANQIAKAALQKLKEKINK